MSPLHDESPAFRQALLKSERLRIFILFFAIGVAFLSAFHSHTDRLESGKCERFILACSFAVTILAAIELFVLRAIRLRYSRQPDLSRHYLAMATS